MDTMSGATKVVAGCGLRRMQLRLSAPMLGSGPTVLPSPFTVPIRGERQPLRR